MKKDKETTDELKTAVAKAREVVVNRQATERDKFLAGDGVVIKRYNKEATKERLAYLKKNRRQLEDARKKSIQVRRRKKKKADREKAILAEQAAQRKDIERRRNTAAREKKPKITRKFIASPEERAKARYRWAANKANYILSRYRERHARPDSVPSDG